MTIKRGDNIRVVANYQRAYTDWLTLSEGEQVTVVARDTQWPAYVWCTSATGKGGWVPESYLSIDGAIGHVLRNYSAHELSATLGEQLTMLDEEGGWYWAVNASGERGWVPAENVCVVR